jgi:hypothetical protein
LHPDELTLHHELRDALNQRLANTSFFVWINVVPTGTQQQFADIQRIVSGVQWWLDTLDPDAIPATEDVPELDVSDPAAEVRVRALPKRPDARAQRSAQIVGNPEPVLVGWT